MGQLRTASLMINELREFASFSPCEQRYIKRSIDIGLGRQDAFKLWARDASEIASIRSQYVAYQELKGLRGSIPAEDTLDGLDAFMGKLVRMAYVGAPAAVVGIVIAGLVLAPEGFAALRAARSNQLQTSLNLAIGSALATIGLTIPAVAVTALMLGLDLELGLSMRGIVLLGLTLLVATITLGSGRTTMVQGVVHLVIFATFLFTSLVP